jgi:hypothetical protein
MTDEPMAPQENAQPAAGKGEPDLSPGEGGDLLSIALLVFFVALLLTVAGLLALPLVLG